MGWARVSDPSAIVKPGDEVTVKVLRIDADKNKISLGLKQLQADPWAKVTEHYAVGQVNQGRVTRLSDFGAFVELEPGVEALAHVSTFPPTQAQDGWKTSVPAGFTGSFEILSVEPDKKRIGVALVGEGSNKPMAARTEIVPGARLTGKVDRIERYGVFVFLAPGRTGLIPMSETGIIKEADLPRLFPIGGDVDVIVLEIEPGGHRIRLSRKAVIDAQERDEVRAFTERPAEGPTEAFGSLAEKLKGALKGKKS
jgi:small subunit ribosomal protein S1